MVRVVAPALFVVAVIAALLGGAPARSVSMQGLSQPAGTPDGLCPAGTPVNWADADVRPFDADDAIATPAAELAAGEPAPIRQLYLVVITLPPGDCMPYSAKGNQKDGAIVLMIQQGIVEFMWEPDPSLPASSPSVVTGDLRGTRGAVLPFTQERYYPGDWITLDQQVHFSYRNVGGDPAIIQKAVWAAPPPPGSGCSGGCK